MSYTSNGFTANDFQKELNEELKKLFAGKLYQCPSGNDRELSLHIQGLPSSRTDDDSEISESPFIVNKLVKGSISDVDGFYKNKRFDVVLLICLYNRSKDYDGHFDLLEVVQKIENHFNGKRVFKNFEVTSFGFVVSEDDTRPFYFGAVTMNFGASIRIAKEDPLA